MHFPGVSQVAPMVKTLPASAGDIRKMGSISRSGRSPGGGHGNPLQYPCLENHMDRGAWQAVVHRVQRVRYDWRNLATTHTHLRMLYPLDASSTVSVLPFCSFPPSHLHTVTVNKHCQMSPGRQNSAHYHSSPAAAAAAAKSLPSCPIPCDRRDGSPPGSAVPGILQARTPEWSAVSFSTLLS